MMKKKYKTNNGVATKRGATSLYVVIFTTLLLGIITLSFVRIILSEATQTSNTDLSQSAYDSALAGIEDAKLALLNYHQCLSENAGTTSCQQIITSMQNGINQDSCDVVRDVLGRTNESGESEVIIQETSSDGSGNDSSELSQAYTCVKIAENLDDYRSTLSTGTRTKIVPVRTDNTNGINSVKIRWYSDINYAAASGMNYIRNTASINNPDYPRNNPNNPYIPPVLSVQFYQADDTFSLTDLYTSEGSANSDRAGVFLYPTTAASDNTISRNAFAATNDKTPGANHSFNIHCGGLTASDGNDREFACEAIINLPRPMNGGVRNSGATFFRIGIPYGSPTTDFSVTLYTGDNATGSVVEFKGVQARVDSTGRANDLYRRLETRVELVDIYYPYPEFAIQVDSNDGRSIDKNFYVTNNCWYSVAGSGGTTSCPNNSSTAVTAIYTARSFFGF